MNFSGVYLIIFVLLIWAVWVVYIRVRGWVFYRQLASKYGEFETIWLTWDESHFRGQPTRQIVFYRSKNIRPKVDYQAGRAYSGRFIPMRKIKPALVHEILKKDDLVLRAEVFTLGNFGKNPQLFKCLTVFVSTRSYVNHQRLRLF